jgi:hypothetical protein
MHNGHGSTTSPATRGVQAGPWARAWVGLVLLAFVNGVLHRSYQGRALRIHRRASQHDS